MSHVLGGKVECADVREYGKTKVLIDKKTSKVFEGVSPETICWMSHFDYISKIAPGFEITAHTADCPVAAAENEAEKLYAIQFHPEVLHTAEGTKMINNFVKNVCECAGDWKMDAFVEHTVKEMCIRDRPAAVKMYMWISTILRFHRRQENRSTVFLPIRNENMFIRWNIRKGRYCSRQTRFCSPSAPD